MSPVAARVGTGRPGSTGPGSSGIASRAEEILKCGTGRTPESAPDIASACCELIAGCKEELSTLSCPWTPEQFDTVEA